MTVTEQRNKRKRRRLRSRKIKWWGRSKRHITWRRRRLKARAWGREGNRK